MTMRNLKRFTQSIKEKYNIDDFDIKIFDAEKIDT
jgi:hypothetical protein